MSATDDVLSNNAEYTESFAGAGLPAPPARKLVVVTCMDARIDVHAVLGLRDGDAHVLRNAGGVVTDDTIRSLAISQRMLGTEEVMLVHHTKCGMQSFTDEDFARELERETGVAPEWAPGAFADLDGDVRESIARVKSSPFLPRRDAVRGFVYEVETGRLREVR
jgi:carbonic anhydrase